MASKKQAEVTEEKSSKEQLFDFDKALDSVFKEMNIEAVNIQRGSFIANSISSGFLVSDLILGGGWPGGRYVMMVGPEGGGKSTFSYYAMREAIKLGTYVIHLDYEGSTDSEYVSRLGLRTDWMQEKKNKKPIMYRNLLLDTGEEGFNLMHRVLKQLPDVSPGGGIQALFVIDSLPSMLPSAVDENDEAAGLALQARMFSKELQKVKTLFSKKNCILFGINQLREKPGPSFGDPTYEPCGNAPRQYSDVRVRINARSAPKPWKGQIVSEPAWEGINQGTDTYKFSLLRTVKHKMFGQFREAWCRFSLTEKGQPGSGIDPVFDAFEYMRMTKQASFTSGTKLVMTMEGVPFSGKTITWENFKELIMNPDHKKAKDTYIPLMCRKQLEEGDGFKRYFDALGGVSGVPSEEDKELIQEDGDNADV